MTVVSRSAVVALLGVLARASAAQVAAAPDTGHAPAIVNTGYSHTVLLPVFETTSFLVLLNAYDRLAYANAVQDGKKVYSSTFATTWDHLRTQHWVHDQDPFNINQFAHPYQGATMYALARSSGHDFWLSLIHSNVGSFIWKMAGETDPPSLNDMITTGQAGSLLGEALYRMADLVLKNSGDPKPGRTHELAAAFISPPGAVNRRVFGERFRAELPETAPATVWQIRVGATADALSKDYSAPTSLLRGDAITEVSMSYGLPGQPGYEYTRPLDYFDFQVSLLSNIHNPIENVMIRGLLVGSKTRETGNSRGIWGLYGTYDYISPYLFRVSSTALSLGTTRQYWLAPGIALQGSLLGGVGFGAAGSTTVIPSTPLNAAIRDYHFGIAPQALLALRLVMSEYAMFDMAAREYYVSGLGSDDTHGSETIFRGDFGLTARVYGRQSLGLRYVHSTRDARYGKQPDNRYTEGTVTVVYSLIGGNSTQAVKWK